MQKFCQPWKFLLLDSLKHGDLCLSRNPIPRVHTPWSLGFVFVPEKVGIMNMIIKDLLYQGRQCHFFLIILKVFISVFIKSIFCLSSDSGCIQTDAFCVFWIVQNTLLKYRKRVSTWLRKNVSQLNYMLQIDLIVCFE